MKNIFAELRALPHKADGDLYALDGQASTMLWRSTSGRNRCGIKIFISPLEITEPDTISSVLKRAGPLWR